MNPEDIIKNYVDAVAISQLSKALFRPPHRQHDTSQIDERLRSAAQDFDGWVGSLPDGDLKEQAKLTSMIGWMLAGEPQPATPLKGKLRKAQNESLRRLAEHQPGQE